MEESEEVAEEGEDDEEEVGRWRKGEDDEEVGGA